MILTYYITFFEICYLVKDGRTYYSIQYVHCTLYDTRFFLFQKSNKKN